MPDLKTIEDHARVEGFLARLKRHGAGLAIGAALGASGTYAAKPQTVTVPPPVDVTEGGMRCTSIGDQLPDGGFVELCRPEGPIEVSGELDPAPPVVSYTVDPRTGKLTHRCEQSSTGPEVCVPLDTDAGELRGSTAPFAGP